MSSIAFAKVLEAQNLLAQNRVDDAAALLMPVATKFPKDPNCISLLSIILFRQRKYPQALHYAQRSVALIPTDVNYLSNLALLLMANGKPREASATYKKALAINPDHAESLLSLANEALGENNASLAAAYCRRVLDKRWDPQVCPTYMAALAGLGEIDEAVEFGTRALAQFPRETLLLSGRCANYNYSWTATPEQIARAHRDFGDAMTSQRPHETFTYKGTLDPSRRLRIGFISSDLRTHSVSFFTEPFLQHHDRTQFEIYVYSTSRHEDKVSRRLEPLVKVWRACGDLIDLEICRLVESDQIDILIDLGGLTQNNNATVFAYKPAPVQATYCGYPNTTGLPTIDWRIVDAITDPPAGSAAAAAAVAAGQPDFDARCTEQLMRLDPCFLCYAPPTDAPVPTRDPAFPGPTFGSFNANKKIVTPLLEVWARLMKATPNSRFILKNFEFKDAQPRERIVKAFERSGVESSRIEVLGPAERIADHLAIYTRIDVAMDTMPYNGTTTTCEALWMGVPVVTTAGKTHAARVSASLLEAVGLGELIARDPEHMIELATQLVNDPARLAAYRATIRGKMAASPLCDATHFAQQMGEALRRMWQEYLARTGNQT
jgi:predicted O-linked N-acetylglucosamine transferase (SPINDLY family)